MTKQNAARPPWVGSAEDVGVLVVFPNGKERQMPAWQAHELIDAGQCRPAYIRFTSGPTVEYPDDGRVVPIYRSPG